MTALQALDVHLTLDELTAAQFGNAIVHLRALAHLSLSGCLDFGYDSDASDNDEAAVYHGVALPALQKLLSSAPELQYLDLSDLASDGQECRPCAQARDLCAAVADAALSALTRLDLCASRLVRM